MRTKAPFRALHKPLVYPKPYAMKAGTLEFPSKSAHVWGLPLDVAPLRYRKRSTAELFRIRRCLR